MSNYKFIFLVLVACTAFFASCSTLENASVHGLNNGFYKLDSDKQLKNVYLDVTEEKIDVYLQRENKPEKDNFLSIPLKTSDSLLITPLKFRKQSLDIDITTILLKYRPSVYGLPPQLTTDMNIALYAGSRHDNYKITNKVDPLGRPYHKITSFGYDLGFFAGPGTTPISPFSTNNKTNNEYIGMIFQMGIAGFLELNMASFGVAVGFDYLLNRDREIWIYNKKPWVGFVIGIALN